MTTIPDSPALFDPDATTASAIWSHLTDVLDAERATVRDRPVTRPADLPALRARVAAYDLEAPVDPGKAVDDTVAMLRETLVHTTHPRYFGLFNPTPTLMSVVGDTLAAAMNPQLAAWSHAPAAAEIETALLRFLGARLGYAPTEVAGSFTSGGAEANLTAVLLALTRTWPAYGDRGLRALDADPVLYASAESHLAWLKIAHATGLGRDAVRLVPVDGGLRLDVGALRRAVAEDRAAGRAPFLVVGTAGTTGAGVVDPLPALADLARDEGLHLHVDAAWAGSAALSDTLAPLLTGIARADSVTLDAHKWLSVPMGAGTFLCRDAAALADTFRVSTSYMPPDVDGAVDPYVTSTQWSRRFTGLKLWLSLVTAGRQGYARQMERDVALGDLLRERLTADGWTLANDTALPVVCLADPATEARTGDDTDASWAWHAAVSRAVVDSGAAWVSPVRLAGRPAVRACLTSHRTTEDDLDALVDALGCARGSVPRP